MTTNAATVFELHATTTLPGAPHVPFASTMHTQPQHESSMPSCANAGTLSGQLAIFAHTPNTFGSSHWAPGAQSWKNSMNDVLMCDEWMERVNPENRWIWVLAVRARSVDTGGRSVRAAPCAQRTPPRSGAFRKF